jgi:hypothetical protein
MELPEMRCSVLSASAIVFLSVCASSAFAQSHTTPAINTCIKEFYDPGMYNYLSFKNTCSQPLTIVFVAKDESGVTGIMDLRPGASDSVGRSESGVVPKVGGFQLYVCQVDYLPLDENNRVVNKPEASFTCRPKTELASDKK